VAARKRTEVPARIVAKLRAICRRLPETYEEKAWVGTRWMVRKRNFAHLVRIEEGWPPAYAKAAGAGAPLVVLTFRASGLLYDTLRTAGPPFFHAEWGTLWGTKVVGMAIGPDVDWDEVALLVTESYRLLAPKQLAAGLPRTTAGRTTTGRTTTGRTTTGRTTTGRTTTGRTTRSATTRKRPA
jgi:hypothetical protein